MGYYMHQNDSKFRIKRENFQKTLDAIKSLVGKETIHDSSGAHFSWVNNSSFAKAATPHAALYEWRWNVGEESLLRDIVKISFGGEKAGDDKILFDAIAPYVEAGSFIEMVGEDGTQWKWIFDGQICEKKFAKIVYE